MQANPEGNSVGRFESQMGPPLNILPATNTLLFPTINSVTHFSNGPLMLSHVLLLICFLTIIQLSIFSHVRLFNKNPNQAHVRHNTDCIKNSYISKQINKHFFFYVRVNKEQYRGENESPTAVNFNCKTKILFDVLMKDEFLTKELDPKNKRINKEK